MRHLLRLVLTFQVVFYHRSQYVYGYMIIAALWYDDVGIAFGGFYKLVVHWFDCFLVAF